MSRSPATKPPPCAQTSPGVRRCAEASVAPSTLLAGYTRTSPSAAAYAVVMFAFLPCPLVFMVPIRRILPFPCFGGAISDGSADTSGAPAGLHAADAVGRDALQIAGCRERRHGVCGKASRLAPLCEGGAYVGVERVHEDAVRFEHVARHLCRAQRLGVDEERPGRHLLHVQHAADLAR